MTDLLIFGVDGMNPFVTRKLAGEGEMPTIQELRNQDGTEDGKLKSHIEDGYNAPHTGPCWTSIYTGVKPEEHGITEGGWREGDSNFDGIRTVWDELSELGHDMELWTMPMTYPAKDINGRMVSGFVSTTLKSLFHKCVSPDEFYDELPDDLRETTASYMAKCELAQGGQATQNTENGFTTLKQGEERRLEIFEDFVDDEKDVVAYGTTFADKIGHINGIGLNELDIEDDVVHDTEEYTKKTYRFVDEMLRRLIEATDPDDVLIVSDHGFSNLSHDLHGYFLATDGMNVGTIFNVTPHILTYFGHDYNKERFGEVEDFESSMTKEEREDVKERLRDLGYIE